MSSTWTPASPGRRSVGTAVPRLRLPDFNVRVNGANLPRAALADIRALTVVEDLDALSMFSLELYNWDDERLRVSWSDSDQFAIGNEVEIWLGWVDDLHRVMLAEITSLEPVFGAGQPPMLTVRGYDHRHRMARGRRTRTFSQIKDSAIAAQVAGESGLRAQVKDTRTTLMFVMQSNQSDWEFLRQRASRIGYEVFVRDKTLYFQPHGHGAQPSARLALGEGVTEFMPRLSALGQEGQMTVHGWDVRKKEAIVGTAGVGQEPRMGRTTGPAATNRAFGRSATRIVDQPVRDKAQADQIAHGQFNELALAYVQGSVTCTGQPQLRAGTVVQLDGAGETFSGPYYVTSVTHTLSQDQGYRTSLTVERNGT